MNGNNGPLFACSEALSADNGPLLADNVSSIANNEIVLALRAPVGPGSGGADAISPALLATAGT